MSENFLPFLESSYLYQDSQMASSVASTMIKLLYKRAKEERAASSSSSTSSSSSSIFLGILGVGLSILFCTSFCRACQRYREAQIEREAWRRTGHDGQPPSIYFIPFPGNISHRDAEDPSREPRSSQDHQPPQYSAVTCGPPPSYNELGFKPEDLPPAYTEDAPAVLPITPPPHTNEVRPQTQ